MNRLFHISEQKNIEQFIPRMSKAMWEHKKYVWSISENKIQNYLLPRDCPRICLKTELFHLVEKHLIGFEVNFYENIIMAPKSWTTEIEECLLYKYEFNSKNFKLIDEIAGYYVSTEIETPIDVTELNSCFEALEKTKAKLVLLDECLMEEIKTNLVKQTNEFSIIRWNKMKKEQ